MRINVLFPLVIGPSRVGRNRWMQAQGYVKGHQACSRIAVLYNKRWKDLECLRAESQWLDHLKKDQSANSKNLRWERGVASLVLLKSTHDVRTQFSFSLSHHLDYGSSFSFSKKSVRKKAELESVRAWLQSWRASNYAASRYGSAGVGRRPSVALASRSMTLARLLVMRSSSTVFNEKRKNHSRPQNHC